MSTPESPKRRVEMELNGFKKAGIAIVITVGIVALVATVLTATLNTTVPLLIALAVAACGLFAAIVLAMLDLRRFD